MNAVTPEILMQIDNLQNRYIAAIGAKNMSDWAATFAEQDSASYICRSTENEEHGWPIALMYDDCRGRILDRITFVEKVWKGTFQDYRTRHFIQRLACDAQPDGSFLVRTNFSIEYTFDPSASKTLATGYYEDVVIEADGEWKFASKKAVYDTTVLPMYIVYPF